MSPFRPDDLRLAHSRADLPPRWDGQPVDWSEWYATGLTSWAFHAPLDQRACTRCGLLDGEQQHAVGRIGDSLNRISVARCPCGHDVVYDFETDEAWDLELEDYGPDGSRVEGSLW